MLRFLIHRPIAVFMSTLAILILALVFIPKVPISMLPEIDIPRIVVYINATNIDARTLENTITRPIRNQLLQINNLNDIESQSRNGIATIELILDHGVNMNLSFIEVNEKIDQILHLLPKNLDRPRIFKTSLSDIPVYQIGVVQNDTTLISNLELTEICNNTISRRFEQLDEVAFVDMSGFALPQVLVSPIENKLFQLGIKLEDLEKAIYDSNIQFGNIILKEGSYEYHVDAKSSLTTIDDVKSIVIRVKNQFYSLRNLCNIEYVERQRKGAFMVNGQTGLSMNVLKKVNASNFRLKDKMELLFAEFNKDYPQLTFYIIDDQTSILKASFGNLKNALLYGIMFASLILLFFFRDWKMASIIALVIPISLLVSLLFFYIFEISINIISLSGLILGVGLMIDNSIILIDNIRQHIGHGSKEESVILGSNEVIRPLISSALTTCSVFLPLILLSGLSGSLFYDLAMSISIALSASLLVSYFVLPVILSHTIQDKNKLVFSENNTHFKIMSHVLRFPWIIVLIFGIFVIYSVSIASTLPWKSLPKITPKAMDIHIDWNEQISLQENEKRIKYFMSSFREDFILIGADIGEKQYQLESDIQHTNECSIICHIREGEYETKKNKVKNFFHQNFIKVLIEVTPKANVVDKVLAQKNDELIVHVNQTSSTSMPNTQQIQRLSDSLQTLNLKIEIPPESENISINILDDKAAIYAISREAIISQLKLIFNDYYITELQGKENYVPIYLGVKNLGNMQGKINSSYVLNSEGHSIPLNKVIELKFLSSFKTITGDRLGEHVSFYFDDFSQEIIRKFKKAIGAFPNLETRVSGNYFDNLQMIKELSFIFGVVLLLLFIILAAQFESFILPFIVLIDVPVSICGSLLCLGLFDQSINLISMVGIIVTAGIVINDSILKIDIISKIKKTGISTSAAILHGSERRLRPILMTTVTTILALVPLLYSTGLGVELQIPLVFAVIGGLTVGTLASLFLIPSIYALLVK